MVTAWRSSLVNPGRIQGLYSQLTALEVTPAGTSTLALVQGHEVGSCGHHLVPEMYGMVLYCSVQIPLKISMFAQSSALTIAPLNTVFLHLCIYIFFVCIYTYICMSMDMCINMAWIARDSRIVMYVCMLTGLNMVVFLVQHVSPHVQRPRIYSN